MITSKKKKTASIRGIVQAKEDRAQLNENKLVSILCDAKNHAGVMLDVGAHYGGSLIPFADAGWKVIAFEPDPNNRSQLQNCPTVINKDVEVVAAAVGSEEKSDVKIFASNESSGVSGLSPFLETHEEVCRVPLLRLDTEIKKRNLKHINYLKVDVEGHEMDVLKGLNLDENSPDFIQLEYEDFKTQSLGYTSHDLCKVLDDQGYKILVSEWWPIQKYGIRHSWKEIYYYNGDIPSDSWGNLIAYKNDIPISSLEQALVASIELESPINLPGPNSRDENTHEKEKSTKKIVPEPSIGTFLKNCFTHNWLITAIIILLMVAIPVSVFTLSGSTEFTLIFSLILIILTASLLSLSFSQYSNNYFVDLSDSLDLKLLGYTNELGTKFSWLKTNSESERRKISREQRVIRDELIDELNRIKEHSRLQDRSSENIENSLGEQIRKLERVRSSLNSFYDDLQKTREWVSKLARTSNALKLDVVQQKELISTTSDFLAKQIKENELSLIAQNEIASKTADNLGDVANALNELSSFVDEQKTALHTLTQNIAKAKSKSDIHETALVDLETKLKANSQKLSDAEVLVSSAEKNHNAFKFSSESTHASILAQLDTADEQIKQLKKTSEASREMLKESIKASSENLKKSIKASSENLEESIKASSETLEKSIEEINNSSSDLKSTIDLLSDKTNYLNKLFLNTPTSNAAVIRQHQRFLSSTDISHFIEKWAVLLNLEINTHSLSYLAFQIGKIEDQCLGRLATGISTSILRVLSLRSIKKKSVSVLEIGTLFGISAIAFNRLGSTAGGKVSVTMIDPLAGYYDKGDNDPITGIPVSKETLTTNLRLSGIPKSGFKILQGLSQDQKILDSVSNNKYDYILIDGDHSYEGVKRDFDLYIDKIKKNGLVLFDDYDTPEWPEIKNYVDKEILIRKDIQLVGSDWRTAIFKKT